jgi:hypothetical protein
MEPPSDECYQKFFKENNFLKDTIKKITKFVMVILLLGISNSYRLQLRKGMKMKKKLLFYLYLVSTNKIYTVEPIEQLKCSLSDSKFNNLENTVLERGVNLSRGLFFTDDFHRFLEDGSEYFRQRLQEEMTRINEARQMRRINEVELSRERTRLIDEARRSL